MMMTTGRYQSVITYQLVNTMNFEPLSVETSLHPVDPQRPPDYVAVPTSQEEVGKRTSTEAMLPKAPGAVVGTDNLRDVLISGVSFGMVFTGYFIVTSFQTSVNASLGAISLAV
jgi:hypothetical protein